MQLCAPAAAATTCTAMAPPRRCRHSNTAAAAQPAQPWMAHHSGFSHTAPLLQAHRQLRQACNPSSSRISSARCGTRRWSHVVAAAGAEAAAASSAAAGAAAQAASPASPSSSSSSAAAAVSGSIPELKQLLRDALQGLDRGIFGVPAAKRQHVASIVAALEARNPLAQPTQHLDQVDGTWELLYTTISITGVKKTKLGLREFIKLGAFQQTINTRSNTALNVVHFRVAGFGLFSGTLTIKASYAVESARRVAIRFVESSLVPDQLQQLFQKNYDLLLSIFNPEGWLDITYVDAELRVGRDDKGNLFVLQRGAGATPAGSDSAAAPRTGT